MALQSQYIIPNDLDPNTPIIVVNFSNVIKLNSTNYFSWKLQTEATLIGHGLFKFLDGSFPAPSPTIVKDTKSTLNPAYSSWVRQDRLLFGALIGTLDQSNVPLISLAATTKELWDTLANIFSSASRGHIKQLKARLKTITKGPQSITEFMHDIKSCTDQLALLGQPEKPDDIVDKVLDGLDASYQGVIDAINARDTPISFAELHEKLINRELAIKSQSILGAIPATAHAMSSRSVNHNQPRYHNNYSGNHRQQHHHQNTRPNHISQSFTQSVAPTGSKPFLGKCQWCHTKGHSLQTCRVFQEKHPTIHLPPIHANSNKMAQVNVATATTIPSPSTWLLDSGASHHVTQDLANLSLHQPYDGTEEIVIGDGSSLPITHTGSMYGGSSSHGTN